MRTQVGIVGAGPAGLMLSHLLHLCGIESIVLECRSRQYIEDRVRAGVLEQGTVDLMIETGVGERLQREGLRHDGVWFSFGGRRHRIHLSELTGGRAITVYAQQEVVKDLVQARLGAGGPSCSTWTNSRCTISIRPLPKIRYRKDGAAQEMVCDFIAGCDGFHGVCRPSAPEGVITAYERVYPFAWLGILAEAAPTSEELIYTYHRARVRALQHAVAADHAAVSAMRRRMRISPQWPDDRVWEELCARMRTEDGWAPAVGPVIQKGVTGMRSFVIEPMQFGRLFLAGDAAHIVPPTGAKGLNLAISDVHVLSQALEAFYKSGRHDLLDQYSAKCLRRIWKVQRFSWWMTSMLHLFPGDDGFDHRRQLAELDYITSSRAGMTSLAENYVGLPLD